MALLERLEPAFLALVRLRTHAKWALDEVEGKVLGVEERQGFVEEDQTKALESVKTLVEQQSELRIQLEELKKKEAAAFREARKVGGAAFADALKLQKERLNLERQLKDIQRRLARSRGDTFELQDADREVSLELVDEKEPLDDRQEALRTVSNLAAQVKIAMAPAPLFGRMKPDGRPISDRVWQFLQRQGVGTLGELYEQPLTILGLPRRDVASLGFSGVRTIGDLIDRTDRQIFFSLDRDDDRLNLLRQRLGEYSLSLASHERPESRDDLERPEARSEARAEFDSVEAATSAKVIQYFKDFLELGEDDKFDYEALLRLQTEFEAIATNGEKLKFTRDIVTLLYEDKIGEAEAVRLARRLGRPEEAVGDVIGVDGATILDLSVDLDMDADTQEYYVQGSMVKPGSTGPNAARVSESLGRINNRFVGLAGDFEGRVWRQQLENELGQRPLEGAPEHYRELEFNLLPGKSRTSLFLFAPDPAVPAGSCES